jgi:CRP/FNR family cyclic AMP-dependent transcriptional regulator
MSLAVPQLNALAHIPLFKGLAAEELAGIAPSLHRKIVPAATNIISVEQIGEAAYIILDGTVKVHLEQVDGTDVILAILGPGEVVGEMGLVDRLGRATNVVTLEETDLLWVDRTSFLSWVRSNPTIAFNLVNTLSRRLRLANAQIQSLATLDVYGRVAHQLLTFLQEYGKPQSDGGTLIPLRLTQSDLADLVGASRVRVNHVLVYYKQQGIISVDHNYRIMIHNVAALVQRSPIATR